MWDRHPERIGRSSEQTVVPSSLDAPQSEKSLPADPTVLAALTEFLDRTREYQLNPDARSAVNPPSQTPELSNIRAGAESVGRPLNADGISPSIDTPISQATGEPSMPSTLANAELTLSDPATAKSTIPIPIIQSVTIRASGTSIAAASPSRTVPTANQSLDVHEPTAPAWDQLIARLQALPGADSDFDIQWRLRWLQLAAGRESEAVSESAFLAAEANRMLTTLARLVVETRSIARDPSRSRPQAVELAEEFRQLVAQHSDPAVSAPVLCRKVTTFGVYEEMAPEEFLAGRTVQSIIYCEMRNVRSEVTEEGRFRSVVATRTELFTPDGRSVWQREEPEVVDTCRRQRTDFFIAQRISLPPTLPAGDYILKISIEDRIAARAAESTRPLTLFAQDAVAKNR